MQLNIKKYDQLFDKNCGYFETFVANGSIVYQKLMDSKKYKKIASNYLQYISNSNGNWLKALSMQFSYYYLFRWT